MIMIQTFSRILSKKTIVLIAMLLFLLPQIINNVVSMKDTIYEIEINQSIEHDKTVLSINGQITQELAENKKEITILKSKNEIEKIINEYSTFAYNKFYNGPSAQFIEKNPEILYTEYYQIYNELEHMEIETLIMSEEIEGNLILTEGENFSNEDFEKNNSMIFPVLLGEDFKKTYKLGEYFPVKLFMDGQYKEIKLYVKGFIKSKTIQPILTNFIFNSTETMGNYFIIGMNQETINQSFEILPSYNVVLNKKDVESLTIDIYNTSNNYYVDNILSIIEEERRNELLQMTQLIVKSILSLIVYIISIMVLILFDYKKTLYENAIFLINGATSIKINFIFCVRYFVSYIMSYELIKMFHIGINRVDFLGIIIPFLLLIIMLSPIVYWNMNMNIDMVLKKGVRK